MDQIVDECYLFSALKSTLRSDLVSGHGFSNVDAGAILNWFDPASERYLEHVSDWQELLCQAAAMRPPLPVHLCHRNTFGSYDIFHLPTHQVGAIHQVAKMFYKWHGVPRKETDMDAVKGRLRRALPMTLDEFEIRGIRDELSCLVPPDLNSVIGRFGPGATYEGFNAYDKWSRKGGIPDVPASFYRTSPRDPKMFRPFGDGITKIAEVPKSIKCNRIVSSEPAMFMYAQLAVNDWLVNQLHLRFPQHISLTCQERHNQALYWPTACSIDLSDASDHVSVSLVQAVLPQFWPVLAKVRSTYSLFPDGDIVELSTFAPMGSGVCFSVMTAVITGILRYVVKTYLEETGKRYWFHVYGDDIIVPVAIYDYTITMLARAGLVVNTSKSCCTQVYRESCGREVYLSQDITPCYIRDPLGIVDASKIEQVIGHLDRSAFPSTALAVAEMSSSIRGLRWNKALQRQEVCVRTTSARQKIRSLDGWDGLNRWFAVGSQGNTWNDRQPSGVAAEVWTKPSWRFKPSWDYPYLTTWLVTRR